MRLELTYNWLRYLLLINWLCYVFFFFVLYCFVFLLVTFHRANFQGSTFCQTFVKKKKWRAHFVSCPGRPNILHLPTRLHEHYSYSASLPLLFFTFAILQNCNALACGKSFQSDIYCPRTLSKWASTFHDTWFFYCHHASLNVYSFEDVITKLQSFYLL